VRLQAAPRGCYRLRAVPWWRLWWPDAQLRSAAFAVADASSLLELMMLAENSGVPRLVGPTVVLRPPRGQDVEDRLQLGLDPEIQRMYGVVADDQPLTRERVTGWFERLAGHPHAWVIEVDGKAVGTARIDNVVEEDARASLAVGIDDPDQLGRGLGTEAIKLVLRHAFEQMRLHRLSLRVLEYNTRAIRAYEKCGFKVEGREREAALVAGERFDDVLMGILAREWRAEIIDGTAR
jgi:RimJ/RimL family protein N-acetyltransferase